MYTCLNPYLRSRFELCNTGSTLITSTKKGEVFYFNQNSIGDIFYQCITHENTLDKYSPINGKSCYALNIWEKALSAQAEPLVPLIFSNKCNMGHIYEIWEIREEVPVPKTAGSHQKVWNWLESSTSNYPMTQSQDAILNTYLHLTLKN
ncbi:hypothetical protein ACS0PU_010115 [Formica fusca]